MHSTVRSPAVDRSEMSQESSPSSDAPERDWHARWAFRAFLAAEAVAFVFYMQISRPMWFYLDEWDFLANRTAFDAHDLFRAHNEHWVTLPVLVYRAMWSIFGLNTYRPYQVLIVLAHLGAALLVRTVMRRVGVRPWTATIVAGAFVFFGSGYQNIVLPFQITLVGSLVFGLVQLLLATHDGGLDRREFFALAAGLAALMCSGVGVYMVVAVGVAVLLARGWKYALLQTVPLGAAYLLWYRWIGHVGYNGYRARPGQVVSFVRSLIASSFRAMGHGGPLALVFGVLLVVGLYLAWKPLPWSDLRRRAAMPLGLLAGTLVLLTITGLGRAGIHTFQEKSRYLHLVAAMTFPALAVAADAIMLRWRARWLTVVVLALFVVSVPGNINTIIDYTHRPIVKDQLRYKQMMLALPRVPTATTVPRWVKPDQYLAHFVTIGWLLDGVKSGRIAKPKPLTPADIAMSDLRLSFLQGFQPLEPHTTCAGVLAPLQFTLAPGERIVVLDAPSGSLRIVPAGAQIPGAYPFPLITTVGNTLTAVRPVEFRISNKNAPFGRVCARTRIMQVAKAAG